MFDFSSLYRTIPGWSVTAAGGDYLIGVLRGEGIGSEIIEPTLRVLEAATAERSIRIRTCFGGSIGKAALRETGCSLSEEVKRFCQEVFQQQGALLCGPAGARFVYDLRLYFDLFCKIIPIRPILPADDFDVLKPAALEDVDIVLVRENVAGVYMGKWGEERRENQTVASHAFEYHSGQVERILKTAIDLAQSRRGRLTLVVKSEGMPSISRLWTDSLREMACHSGIATEILEVDNAAYQLIHCARKFDVMVTSNMMGDILGDLGAVLLGAREMSFSGNFGPAGRAVYQTAHGAAHGLAGQNIANPLGQILSLSMLLRINFRMFDLADRIEAAVKQVLKEGWRTVDMAFPGCKHVGTREMGDRIAEAVRASNLEAERAACPLPNPELLSKVASGELIRGQAQGETLPAGVCGGKWIDGKSHETWAQHDPAEWEKVIAHVALATPEDFHVAIELARQAQVQWARTPSSYRLQVLKSWSSVLATHEAELAEAMAKELGKPITLARQEIQFAMGLLRATVEQNEDQASQPIPSGGIWGRHCPRGIVGVVTPWNNPVAIPAGKIGPALFHGNAVIWKPALQAPRTTLLLSQTISEAGFPKGLVNVLFGGPSAVRNLIARQEISFLSFTGSISAGREVASLCGSHGKTFQGELGGNNAAIIMPDVDVSGIAREAAFSAFAYAGQRCTATRRFLVHVDRAREFQDALLASVQSMCLGHPMDEQTIIGPVISREKQKSLELVVQEGLAQGAQLICGGKIPPRWTSGCWFEPTLLAAHSSNLTVVQEETFGPVAVWQVINDLKEGLQQLNSVSQGLTASLYSNDPAAWNLFREEAECGVLKLNQPTMGVDPGVPFGGWKASGIGTPEHGPGDVESYTRWQAVYTPLPRSI